MGRLGALLDEMEKVRDDMFLRYLWAAFVLVILAFATIVLHGVVTDYGIVTVVRVIALVVGGTLATAVSMFVTQYVIFELPFVLREWRGGDSE